MRIHLKRNWLKIVGATKGRRRTKTTTEVGESFLQEITVWPGWEGMTNWPFKSVALTYIAWQKLPLSSSDYLFIKNSVERTNPIEIWHSEILPKVSNVPIFFLPSHCSKKKSSSFFEGLREYCCILQGRRQQKEHPSFFSNKVINCRCTPKSFCFQSK